jgi:hypothetical protein
MIAMDTSELLFSLDSEIFRLQQARALLVGQNGQVRPGNGSKSGGKARIMSAAARARIGAVTKARWAAGKMGKQSRNPLKETGH